MAPTIPPTVLLTRPLEASRRFAELLDTPVVISPLMETVWLSPATFDRPPDALVFTSSRGVAGFARVSAWRGPAYCVGDRTALAAREAGFTAQSAGGGVDELAQLLQAEAQGKRLLHARGREVAGDLSAWVEPYVVYAQEPRPLNAEARACLMSKGRVVVPLFSPNSATHFGRAVPDGIAADLRIIAMSRNVAAAAQAAGLKVQATAASPTGGAMLDAVRGALA